MPRRSVPYFLVVVLLSGCLHPVREHIDTTVCALAQQPHDLEPVPLAETSRGPGQEEKGDRLEIPPELQPGSIVPAIKLPPDDEKNKEARKKALDALFPPLPKVPETLQPSPGPQGLPLTLSDLQKLALTNSPLIRQATARVEEARGIALQAGLPKNPTVGYEGDTAGTAGGPGYQGAYVEQLIKTGNKLQLARAAAMMDVHNAELALKKAQAELATKVRSGYFAVLVAQESVKLNSALTRFTSRVYEIQLDQMKKGGQAAPYEPMYLRALTMQSRAALVQSRNRLTSAWKQLAANLGLPGMPPTQLAGKVTVPYPHFDHKEALAQILAKHTDILATFNTRQQAQYALQLARLQPVPDVNVRFMLQKDTTSPTFALAHSLAVSVPIPVWDRNQGGIMQAQAFAVRASEELHRVRSELTANLAEAFERYQNNATLLNYYRDSILPDLIRVYRGVSDRYQNEVAGKDASVPNLGDVVMAQQNLSTALATYLTTLGGLWQAVVDVAGLLQTDDLFGINPHPVADVPDLESLFSLPCCHCCSPIPGAHHRVVDGDWPK